MQNLTLHRSGGEKFLVTLQEDSTPFQVSTHTVGVLPRAQGMNIAVFRLGVNWVVRTKTQELTFTELGDAMNAAARYAKAEDHADSYRGGWPEQAG